MSADEWKWVKTIERPVQTSKDEWRRIRDEFIRVQTNESAILSFMNPESPSVFTSKRTCNCKFEIKPCVEDFVLCVSILSFLIHNTNSRFTEHDNAQATKN